MQPEQQAILSELYNELRWYRSKEYQTFLFTVPIVGVGFDEDFNSAVLTAVLIGFALIMLCYIWANLKRMHILKSAIADVQSNCGIESILRASGINSKEWAKKPWYKHLGTLVYTVVIIAEITALFVYTFWPKVLDG